MKITNYFACLIFILLCIASNSPAQSEGEYTIQSALGGKYLDVQWGNATAGTPLHLWEHNGGVAQKFTLENAGDGYFYIKSALGRYVHVPNVEGAERTIVTLGDLQNADHYKWKFENSTDGYQLIRSKTGTYLDVQWGSSESGTPIWMWTHNGGNAQRWKLNPIMNLVILENLDLPPVNLPQPTRIAGALWQGAFTAALNNADIKVDNYTNRDFEFSSDNTYRYLQPDNCYFKMTSSSGDFEYLFNIDTIRFDPVTVYVDELNFSRARTTHKDGKIRLLLYFEQDDLEVRVNCVDNFFCGAIGNPNFNLENPMIEVMFLPIVRDGQITYDELEVSFNGHLAHEGFNMTVGPMMEIVKLFDFDLDSELANRANTSLTNRLNRPEIKQQITNTLNNSFRNASSFGFEIPDPVTRIVVDSGGDLLLY